MFKKNLIIFSFLNAVLCLTPVFALEKQCFIQKFKQDKTTVSLNINGTQVTGTMTWEPYEQDGARGTLKGEKQPNGELHLVYEYVIEGSHQTEVKHMKVKDKKLWIKVGELVDPKNNGNLVYKDAKKAKYTEVLSPIKCR